MRFWLFGTSSAVCSRDLRRLGVLMMVQTLFGGCVGGDLDLASPWCGIALASGSLNRPISL